MTERDLKTLEKNLRDRLGQRPACSSAGTISGSSRRSASTSCREKVQEIESEFVDDSGHSAATEDLVRKFFGLEASSDLFDLTCLSLSALLDKKYKKDFILLADSGWGKWHLKSILNALPEGLALSAPMAAVPELEELEKPEMSIVQDFPIKIYLDLARDPLRRRQGPPQPGQGALPRPRVHVHGLRGRQALHALLLSGPELLPGPPGFLRPVQYPPGDQLDPRKDRPGYLQVLGQEIEEEDLRSPAGL